MVSRTSAFEFKGKAQNMRKIGEQLKVSAVVEGSVRRLADRIRVSTQLVNVSDGFCLWSQRFDCKMTDIFDVQEEIAKSIADLLKVELDSKIGSSGLVKRYTDNFEAYDLYLRGRFQWNKRSGEGFQKALEYFERALALDPNYAPAYAGIADYHVSVASWGLEAPTEAWPKAKDAVKKALAADDSLAEAHASLGIIRMWYEWNWKEAEREFLRAIELKPGLPISARLLQPAAGADRPIRRSRRADPAGAGQRSALRSGQYLSGGRISLPARLRPLHSSRRSARWTSTPTTSKRTSSWRMNLGAEARVPAGHCRAGKGIRTRRPQSADPGAAGLVLRRRRAIKRRR